MHLEEAYILEVTKLMEYVDSKEDPLIQIIRTHKHNKLTQCYKELEASRENYKEEKDK